MARSKATEVPEGHCETHGERMDREAREREAGVELFTVFDRDGRAVRVSVPEKEPRS